MKRFLIILLVIVINANVFAQISTNETPFSFGINAKHWNDTKIVVMPALDMAKIDAEDHEDEEYGFPPRFGYPHKVNYDLKNSGTWCELPNGDKLWQLNVVCPNALSVNFCYDKFWIPEGGKLYVYSKDRNHCIGAFTSRNNKGDSINVRGFATGLVYGSDVIMEYYQPKKITSEAIISIEYVVHGYRYINFGEKTFDDAGSCMVNVNCEEGQDWQNEKKAVARIIIEGAYYCTGSLLTTTDFSEEPFFLTANHCISKVGKDALEDPSLDYTFFYWNYEAPGCISNNIEPSLYSTSGATILANNIISDFALLQLTEDPKDLPNYTPYYLGWDCSGEAGNPGVCIHHPKGDVKKISTIKSQPQSSYLNDLIQYGHSYWKVTWKATLNGHGVTQGGSSGASLITDSHKVIGQLYGSNCQDCKNLNGNSVYGKFDVSWTGNFNDSIQRRLSCWLDSLGTGVQTMEGLLVIPTDSTMIVNQQLYCNIRITNSGQLTIRGNIELMGSSCIIVESGGKLIIDGGSISNVDLELKPGSSLRIINNGILVTRNGFNAPFGAVVDVGYGHIL